MQTRIAEHKRNDMEALLESHGMSIVKHAASLIVDGNEGYNAAAELLRQIKNQSKAVKDYWGPIKTKAKAAHQEVVDREKTMLNPLMQAEAIVKKNMSAYQMKIEEERRRAEEEIRKCQQEERDRLLEEALRAEEQGDKTGATTNLAMAEMVEGMVPVAVDALQPKAEGISVKTVWKARITDPDKIPVSSNGIEIRPIDIRALNNIARITKGTAVIAGVEFYPEKTISARSY